MAKNCIYATSCIYGILYKGEVWNHLNVKETYSIVVIDILKVGYGWANMEGKWKPYSFIGRGKHGERGTAKEKKNSKNAGPR